MDTSPLNSSMYSTWASAERREWQRKPARALNPQPSSAEKLAAKSEKVLKERLEIDTKFAESAQEVRQNSIDFRIVCSHARTASGKVVSMRVEQMERNWTD